MLNRVVLRISAKQHPDFLFIQSPIFLQTLPAYEFTFLSQTSNSPSLRMVNDEVSVRSIAKRLPKPQLHLHLDGSLPEALIEKLASAHGVNLPSPPEKIREHLLAIRSRQQATNSYTQKPAANWDTFSFINSLLRTPADLATTTTAVILELKRHNVVLAEIRFCPTLYPFAPEEAIEAVSKAFSDSRMKGGVILCALRSYPPQHVERIAHLAKRYQASGVIGIDLAGDEGSYPLSVHEKVLAEAVKNGVNVTVHAGEWGPSAEENLRRSLLIPAKRVGHALVLRKDNIKLEMGEIFVETCLTANCSGGTKVAADQFHLHPVKRMLEAGVRVAGFNCDNLLLSGTLKNRPDPTEEIVRAKIGCGLSWHEIELVLVDGVRASFDGTVLDDGPEGSFCARFQKEVREVLSSVIDN